MTSNDKQIDALLRHYLPRKNPGAATGHLDADEMNAFAEGALPTSVRARYVSHLADCDQCRKNVTQLTLSAGMVSRAEQAQVSESRTFWQALAGVFSLPVLRYAGLAAVVVIVGGLGFLVFRQRSDSQRSESPLVAVNQPIAQRDGDVVRPSAGNERTAPEATKQSETRSTDTSRLPADLDEKARRAEPKPAEAVSQPLLAAKEPAPAAPPVSALKKSDEQVSPSYAPAPPGDIQTKTGTQSVGGICGPRYQQQQKAEGADKLAIQERERDVAKDAKRADDFGRKSVPSLANQSNSAQVAGERGQGPMRNMENMSANRAGNENRPEAAKSKRGTIEDRASTEETQTRSVSGRKFRRQGNAWVDQKFKSSMTLKNISRGSEEFEALDSGLRSIAQQLGGQIIVVWKGKAYQIN